MRHRRKSWATFRPDAADPRRRLPLAFRVLSRASLLGHAVHEKRDRRVVTLPNAWIRFAV